MRMWTAFWFLVATAIATFTAMNWQTLNASTAINLVFWRVSAPLGLVMIGALVVLTLFYLAFLVWLETRALMQINNLALSREPAAGLGDLRTDVERQIDGLRIETAESNRALVNRIEQFEETIRRELRNSQPHAYSEG
jgi:hypothetical protein